MRKIIDFIKRLFDNTKSIISRAVKPSIKVVELIKSFVNSDGIALLTRIIPTEFDDILVLQLKKYLPAILIKLRLAETVTDFTDRDAVIQAAILELKKIAPDAKGQFYLNIASMLSNDLQDGKLDIGEIVLLVQYTYSELKK